MIGQVAIAVALLGINDLGRSVTTTFLFTIISSLSKTEQKMKSMWEVKKKLKFLSTGHGVLPSCGCKGRETMVTKCELFL